MSHLVDRKAFLSTLGCAAGCAALVGPLALHASDQPKPATKPAAPVDSGAKEATIVFRWLSPFVVREEKNLDRDTLIKLLEERGRLCCRLLEFRQKLIADSAGNVDRLVELMAGIVGRNNCTRSGDTISLVYPQNCLCKANPKREPTPDDPYCECSKANNQELFRIVSGRPVQVRVVESPRRGGKVCRFHIQLG